MYYQSQPVIVEASTASVKRHVWYLTPELVVLALVDKDISEWAREKMAAQLLESAEDKPIPTW